ncbi:hypothetical protein GPECTOR_65g197 [Gonium pectorale]|uniref:K Homology domain-containing protein n=1 Tax=Gonium pectorale TaxID=33097 RepID=A0A150G3W5_GONPE|nr:hypothetical protein GPECTOR_65g197 [Gonium pectorale]|eukprot:KXZ44579.1 hypothetical protein GPECTOR_65g197 [Gonium pectorale]
MEQQEKDKDKAAVNSAKRKAQEKADAEAKNKRRKPSSAQPIRFRLLCLESQAGAIIGKGGDTVRHIRKTTGAEVAVLPPSHGQRLRICLIDSGPGYPGKEALLMCATLTVEGDQPLKAPDPSKQILRETRHALRVSSLKIHPAVKNTGVRLLEVGSREPAGAARCGAVEALAYYVDKLSQILPLTPGPGGRSRYVVKMLLPCASCGAVVGPRGAVIRAVSAATGAGCVVHKRGDVPPYASSDEQELEADGDPRNVLEAIRMVATLVRGYEIRQHGITVIETLGTPDFRRPAGHPGQPAARPSGGGGGARGGQGAELPDDRWAAGAGAGPGAEGGMPSPQQAAPPQTQQQQQQPRHAQSQGQGQAPPAATAAAGGGAAGGGSGGGGGGGGVALYGLPPLGPSDVRLTIFVAAALVNAPEGINGTNVQQVQAVTGTVVTLRQPAAGGDFELDITGGLSQAYPDAYTQQQQQQQQQQAAPYAPPDGQQYGQQQQYAQQDQYGQQYGQQQPYYPQPAAAPTAQPQAAYGLPYGYGAAPQPQTQPQQQQQQAAAAAAPAVSAAAAAAPGAAAAASSQPPHPYYQAYQQQQQQPTAAAPAQQQAAATAPPQQQQQPPLPSTAAAPPPGQPMTAEQYYAAQAQQYAQQQQQQQQYAQQYAQQQQYTQQYQQYQAAAAAAAAAPYAGPYGYAAYAVPPPQ